MAITPNSYPFSGGAFMGGSDSPVTREDIHSLNLTKNGESLGNYNPLVGDASIDIPSDAVLIDFIPYSGQMDSTTFGRMSSAIAARQLVMLHSSSGGTSVYWQFVSAGSASYRFVMVSDAVFRSVSVRTAGDSSGNHALTLFELPLSELRVIRTGNGGGDRGHEHTAIVEALAAGQTPILCVSNPSVTFYGILNGTYAGDKYVFYGDRGGSLVRVTVIADNNYTEEPVIDLSDYYTKLQTNTLLAGKQDVISDLSAIRSGAAAGATAVQPSDMNTALAGKQDVISDLSTIRSGASAGATAVQPADMNTALADKQKVISIVQGAPIILDANGNLDLKISDGSFLDGLPESGVYYQIGDKLYKVGLMPDGKIWMCENLDYGSSGAYYNNDESTYGWNGLKYGKLYTWDEAAAAGNAISGWHLPSSAEWDALATACGGASVAGTKLKSTTGWSSGNGDGSTDFAAFPAGNWYSGSFSNLGGRSYFWTATETSATSAHNRYFGTGASMTSGNTTKTHAYSVRLVKD